MWLANWPILRLHRSGAAQPDRPAATIAAERGQLRLAALCPAAAAIGLRVGQALAEARALCPGLDTHEATPAEDAAALARLAAWATRFTPLAAPDPPDGLWLDIAGCAHLHGGEAQLCATLGARLARDGLPARLAIADASGAAWALARAVRDGQEGRDGQESEADAGHAHILAPGGERDALALLPIGLLRLDDRSIAGLRRVGIKTIGALARLPRGEVSARFGKLPVLRLDQAFGHGEEPIAWPQPPQPWCEECRFAEPIATPEDLTRALAALAAALAARLEAEGRGARRFIAAFHRVDGEIPRLAIATARPVRAAGHVLKLLAAKLDTLDPGFGVEAMRLAAEAVGPLGAAQARLDGGPDHAADLATTLDTLIGRLGEAALWRPAAHGSHIPERATTRIAPLAIPPSAPIPVQPERPIRLLDPPEPIEATAPVPDDPPLLFRWRGALHRVRAATGPERIAVEWWRRPPDPTRPAEELVRDYYRVEDTAGGRFWVFRAGLHAPGAAMPRWFLHGVFG